MSGNRTIAIAYGVCGAACVTAQFSLARATLVSLSGNELGVGLLLSLWLLFAGAGSVLASRAARNRPGNLPAFPALLVLLGVLITASCYWIALARRLLFGLTYSLSISGTLALAALAAFPVSAVVGALFVAALRAARAEDPGRPQALYLADAIGSFAGGLAASFLLAPALSTLRIALVASAVVFVAAAASAARGRLAVAAVAALSAVAAGVVAAVPRLYQPAETTLAQLRFSGGTVVATADSRYQSFAAVRSRESLSFYQDGVLAWFSQAGEREEEIAHLALLSRERPGRVLVVGPGWPFLPREILKEPVESLDLIVEDREVHSAGVRALAGEDASFLSDPRLRVRYGEPARVLSERAGSDGGLPYDAAFIDVGAPDTLLAARLVTREFFLQLRAALAGDGIVVLAAPSVESYLSRGLLGLNASLHATLVDVFGAAVVVPGEYAGNVFVAGAGVSPGQFGQARLAASLDARGIVARWINRHSLAEILDPRRMADLSARIRQASSSAAMNTLERPVAVLSGLEYREELSGGSLPLALLRGFRLWHVAAGLAVLAVALLAARLLARRDFSLPACASAAGFCGMVSEIALLCAFQLSAGNLYEAIALLVGLFMAGMAIGSALSIALGRKLPRPILLAALLCFGAAVAVASALTAPRILEGLRGGFAAFAGCAMVLSGLASGASATLLLSPEPGQVHGKETDGAIRRRLPGLIYGAELAGGALGGALSSILFFPVIGTTQPLWFAAVGYGFALLVQPLWQRRRSSV